MFLNHLSDIKSFAGIFPTTDSNSKNDSSIQNKTIKCTRRDYKILDLKSSISTIFPALNVSTQLTPRTKEKGHERKDVYEISRRSAKFLANVSPVTI